MGAEDETLPVGYEDPVAGQSVPVDAPNSCGPSNVPLPGPGDLVNDAPTEPVLKANGPIVSRTEPGCINLGGRTSTGPMGETNTGPSLKVDVGNCGNNPRGVDAYGGASTGTTAVKVGGTTGELEGPNAKGGLSVNPNTGGFKLGAQANLGGVSFSGNTQNYGIKVGLSAGVGAEARRDNCGFGGEIGPLSFDVNRRNCNPTAAR